MARVGQPADQRGRRVAREYSFEALFKAVPGGDIADHQHQRLEVLAGIGQAQAAHVMDAAEGVIVATRDLHSRLSKKASPAITLVGGYCFAVFTPPREIRFNGAVLVPAGSHAVADVHSATSLSLGRIIRRGSADPGRHDPPRTMVVLPPRNAGVRVVLITYD